jgi:hypothetical protein
MSSLAERRETNCTDAEWEELLDMPQVRINETPSEWMNRIWPRLQYFRKNNLLPNKRYFEARKLVSWYEANGSYKSYAPEIGIAICFSCNQLVYIEQRTKNIGNYNHIGIERHWATHCIGNSFCDINYEDYLEFVKESKIRFNYDHMYSLYRYELWMGNIIKKVKRAREICKKIRACTIIQRKFIKYYYRPSGMCATQLALHYKLLWAVREEMRQINNV